MSASHAIARFAGPVLLVHGTEDRVVPPGHMTRLAAIARRSRAGDPDAAPVEVLSIPGGHHSWLFEWRDYRTAVARFLATSLGGPLEPEAAAAIAADVPAVRLPDVDAGFSALDGEPGGVRTLVRAIRDA